MCLLKSPMMYVYTKQFNKSCAPQQQKRCICAFINIIKKLLDPVLTNRRFRPTELSMNGVLLICLMLPRWFHTFILVVLSVSF